MYDYGLNEEDEVDEMFRELDLSVELAEEHIALQKRNGAIHPKYSVNFRVMSLIMEEVPEQDIRVKRDCGGICLAEVQYKGIPFICAVGPDMPESWKEFEK